MTETGMITIMMISIIVCSVCAVLFHHSADRRKFYRKRRYDVSEENPWDELLKDKDENGNDMKGRKRKS